MDQVGDDRCDAPLEKQTDLRGIGIAHREQIGVGQRVAKRQGLLKMRHGKPADAFPERRLRHRHESVAVGVGLYNKDHFAFRGDARPHGPDILLKPLQIYFNP